MDPADLTTREQNILGHKDAAEHRPVVAISQGVQQSQEQGCRRELSLTETQQHLHLHDTAPMPGEA